MTNKDQRLAASALLGLPSAALLLFVAKRIICKEMILDFRMYDVIALTWLWAQAGLAYRAFETCDDFNSPPWGAYLFSYQIRLAPAAIFISTTAVLLITAAKAPLLLAVGLSGPSAFVFGREPKLSDFLKILDKK